MHLLLAEDEAGILEGLATFLRMKGHVVRTAPSCRVAIDCLATEQFDALVTDWRLGDGSGSDVLAAAPEVPALVMSGWPEEVVGTDCIVLTKPVRPRQLVAAVEQLGVGGATEPTPIATPELLRDLPVDSRARLQLMLDVLEERAVAVSDVSVEDDGEIVAMTVITAEPDAVRVERALTLIESIVADFRVRTQDGVAVVDARLWRDGRPDHIERVVRLQPGTAGEEGWPALEVVERVAANSADSGPLAIDCDVDGLTPARFLELLDAVCRLRRRGCEVHLLNLPESLRLLAETQGRRADLPTRTRSGPRLPPVLQALWR